MNEELQAIINTSLEHESKVRGKRFSTHQEANACVKERIDDTIDRISPVVDKSRFLWDKMRMESFDSEYLGCILSMKDDVLCAMYSLIGTYVMLSKYERGVVHEPSSVGDCVAVNARENETMAEAAERTEKEMRSLKGLPE